METALIVAIVGAAAALLGGVLAAVATRRVEFLRLKANLLEKADERKLQALEAFMLAANAWLDWLMYIEDQGWQERGDELDRRVKARDDSYRRVQLLASESLRQWFTETYAPLERELKRTYVSQLRNGPAVEETSRQVRRRYSGVLREDLVARFRSEVTALREPVAALSARLVDGRAPETKPRSRRPSAG